MAKSVNQLEDELRSILSLPKRTAKYADPFDGLLGSLIPSKTPRGDWYMGDEGEVYTELDVPGLTKEDISIKIIEGIIEVTAANKDGSRDYSSGIALPDNADLENICASVKNGVLKIAMTLQTAKEHQIQVQ